jgi:triphosphoribosyl-dephospho-CoA synthase
MKSDALPVSLSNMTGCACMWEVSARKAGNVHPNRAFSDLNIDDFLNSALAIAPLFADAGRQRVGGLVLSAIQATRRVVRTNTNLGIVLLLVPLAVGRRDRPLGQAVVEVLENLTVEDSRQVYEAIRLARPGGMGQVAEEDVHGEPTLPLRQVMALAQKRDLIARQYVNGFQEVLHEGLPALLRGLNEWGNLEDAIVGTHLELLAHHPDSLIVRKCGIAVAEDASHRAQVVLNAGWPLSEAGQQAFAAFDAWLREDGNRRNPGTSADLLTACIFAALRDNEIGLPLSVPWSRS